MMRLVLLLSVSLTLSLTSLAPAPLLAQDATPAPVRGQAAPSAAKLRALQDNLAQALKDPKLTDTKIAIHIVDGATGQSLYDKDADLPMNPASNAKLLTAAAALAHLGPAHTQRTELRAVGAIKDVKLDGDVFLWGCGEPSLFYRHMLELASGLRGLGVTQVTGDLRVDDTCFGPGYVPPGFDQKDEDASYRVPLGGVSTHFNAVTLTATAAPDKPTLTLTPANDHVRVIHEAKTVAGKANRLTVTATDEGDRTVLRVTGTLGLNAAPVTVRKRVGQPGLYAGALLRRALGELGVTVGGAVKLGAAPKGARVLASHTSEPVVSQLLAMNTWSNNFIAEQLFRQLGLDPSGGGDPVARARQRVLDTLKALGVNTAGLKIFNGSGLYVGNEVSARQLTTLLHAMLTHRHGPEFMASLPLSGDDGTLSGRLNKRGLKGQIRAKTGTLNAVLSLSGYAYTATGRTLVFSIIFNDPPRLYAWQLRDAQDKLVEAMMAAGL